MPVFFNSLRRVRHSDDDSGRGSHPEEDERDQAEQGDEHTEGQGDLRYAGAGAGDGAAGIPVYESFDYAVGGDGVPGRSGQSEDDHSAVHVAGRSG